MAIVVKQVVFVLQGVVEFSLCLLFAKLVSYTFLYWLPLYIANVGKNSTSNPLVKTKTTFYNQKIETDDCSLVLLAHFDPKHAGDLSTLFDVGGIVGKHMMLVTKCFILPMKTDIQ